MQAIVDCMVMFYKRQNEMLLKLLNLREREIECMREERNRMREQINELNQLYEDEELRANALHDVIDVMIERQTYGSVRRDLIEAFNEVAEDLDIDLELYEVEDLVSDNE